MLVSSANIFAQAVLIKAVGEVIYIYIKKSKGPRILPCGTPQVSSLALDNASPLTLRFWLLLVR